MSSIWYRQAQRQLVKTVTACKPNLFFNGTISSSAHILQLINTSDQLSMLESLIKPAACALSLFLSLSVSLSTREID